jgi:MFS family permease
MSIIAWVFIPSYSCDSLPCPWRLNVGWRIVLLVLGLLTLLIVICRVIFFRLDESPRYLISKQRYQEAVIILHRLARMNNKRIDLSMEDFVDIELKYQGIKQKPDIVKSSIDVNIERIKILFKSQYLKTTVILLTIHMFVNLGNNMFFGINNFNPRVYPNFFVCRRAIVINNR